MTASVIAFARDKFFCCLVNLFHSLALKDLKNNFHSLTSVEAPLDKNHVYVYESLQQTASVALGIRSDEQLVDCFTTTQLSKLWAYFAQ